MYTSELVYEGGLRTLATHVYSGTQIYTDAPLDNQGRAESFSPSDLVATALAACMITIMGIEARKVNIQLEGTTMKVTKTMAPNPRRIVKVEIYFSIPGKSIGKEQRAIFENAAHSCPVAMSVHPDIIQEITFDYND